MSLIDIIFGSDKRVIKSINEIGEQMANQQEQINAVVAKLTKAKGEIIAKIAELQEQIDAGETPDLTELLAVAQGLDDINPDAETEVPTEV